SSFACFAFSPYVFVSPCGSTQYPPTVRGNHGALTGSATVPPPPAHAPACAPALESGGGGGGSFLASSFAGQPHRKRRRVVAREARADKNGMMRVIFHPVLSDATLVYRSPLARFS